MVARGAASGVLHADDITHVLRHIELNADTLVEVHSLLAELGIAVDDGMEELHDDTPHAGAERPPSVEVEDTEGLLARRVRRRSERMSADRNDVGNTADTVRMYLKEIGRVDLLSVDAVRVQPGTRVLVEQWGGPGTIAARVRRIEPSGFTKVSALGVEEQRVNVILEFTEASGAWTALGDGYRVEARLVTWEAADVLTVPTGALVRAGDQWAVFVVRNGRAEQQVLTLGHQNGQQAEVASGIEAGAVVVLHPGDTLVSGSRVQPR